MAGVIVGERFVTNISKLESKVGDLMDIHAAAKTTSVVMATASAIQAATRLSLVARAVLQIAQTPAPEANTNPKQTLAKT